MKTKTTKTIRALGLTAAAMCAALTASALELELGTLGTGDGGHGWGVIAEYGDGGPGELTITRNTLPGLPPPDYWKRWGRLCSLRVYDPEGFLMAYVEMGDQSEAAKTYTVALPKGKAGRYRFSMSGGFVNVDTFAFKIPDPLAWGVRGEKILKLVGRNLPEKMFMAFAPTSDRYYLTGNNVSWNVAGEEGRSQHGAKATMGQRRPGEEIVELTIDRSKGWMSLYCDGLPNTLSPTPEMAKRIMGGAVAAKDGTLCEGPLQAKLWDACVRIAASEDLTCTPEESAKFLATLGAWESKSITNTVYDATRSAFGYAATAGFGKTRGFDFYHYDTLRYQPGNLAKFAADNPGDERALKRAAISAFVELAHMDGAAIMRETAEGPFFKEHGYSARPLAGQRIDCATMFETMAGLGRGYKLLKDRLPASIARVYREAVLDVCYKELGFLCYQSNQFMHIRECLNDVYCATGDAHLERCLRMELEAFVANHFHGKHGQHPAGFYLEEYGPDGNYDQMSLRPMSVIYNTYREMPGHDAGLVEKMKASIERNLDWRSLFEIVNPANGRPYQLAFAMNHRTDGPTHFDSHHGLANLSNEFDMAYTMLKLGEADADPAKLRPLPYAQEEACVEKDGFVAVKRGGFYAVDFYKIYDEIPDGFLGPMFLWHEKAGLGLCGVKHSYHRQPHWFGPAMEERDVTFPTVYGQVDGKLFVESRRMQKTFAWIEKGRSWKVTGVCYQPPKGRNAPKLVRGTLGWTTEIVSDDVVEMTVEADFADLKDATVNLPILRQKGETVWSANGWRESAFYPAEGRYVQKQPTGATLTITWPKDVASSLVTDTPCTRGWCENLRLRLPEKGALKIRYEVKGPEAK